MKFDLCKQLGIKYPIFGGAMTGISDPVLTAAISETGAFGVYACGMNINDIGAVREGIQECKHLTDKPFGVNVSMVAPIIDELMDCVCRENIAAVTTGAGSPEKYVPMLKEAGVSVIPVIASPRQARKMASAGVTAVVAEGFESGGNAGRMATMPLIPRCATPRPIYPLSRREESWTAEAWRRHMHWVHAVFRWEPASFSARRRAFAVRHRTSCFPRTAVKL